MKKPAIVTIMLLAAAICAPCVGVSAAVRARTIEYKDGAVVLEGYLAYDDARSGKMPAVLIVHEWTGLGPYVKKRAEQLAGLGYAAFAVDMYGKGIRPDNPKDAGAQAGVYRADRALMRQRALAGLTEVKKFKFVDARRIAAIGYCFGGGVVLELARSGADIKGVASFHGNLDTPNPKESTVKAKVLVLHGADDPHVSGAQVAAFEEEMRLAAADWQLIAYGGAVHSFTNPDAGNDPAKGAAYNKKADQRSWKALLSFFEEIFKL